MRDRGPYDCVTRGMWASEDFRSLSAPKPNAQTMWFRLLTGPERGSIPGLFSWTEGGFADRMKWPVKDVRRCLLEITSRGMAVFDAEAGLMWLPSAFEHNPPTSVNQVKAWGKASRAIPPCELKTKAMASLMASLMAKGMGWAEPFASASGMASVHPSPIHKQEQYLNQNQDLNHKQEQEARVIEIRPVADPDPDPSSFTGSDVERLFDAERRIVGGPKLGFRQKLSDYQRLTSAAEWARRTAAETGETPEALTRASLKAFLASSGRAREEGWPFTWWANDPGSHLARSESNKGPIAAKSAANYDHAGGANPWDL